MGSKFNPHITLAEYDAMSRAERREWDLQWVEYQLTDRSVGCEPRGFNRIGGIEPFAYGE